MNYTENYQLPQWVETDRVLMEDFNNAFAKMDASIPQILYGTYTGTGGNTVHLTIGKQVRFLLIMAATDVQTPLAIVTPQGGGGVGTSGDVYTIVTWSAEEITFRGANAITSMNVSGASYCYCAYCA